MRSGLGSVQTITLNKWQRLIVALGAATCLLQAYGLWFDAPDEWRPGLTFLGGVVLAVLALSPVREGEEALPFARYIGTHRRRAFATLAAAGAALLLFLFAPLFMVEETTEIASETVEFAADPQDLVDAEIDRIGEEESWLSNPFPELDRFAEPRRVVPRGEVESWLAEEMRKERDSEVRSPRPRPAGFRCHPLPAPLHRRASC